MTTIKIKPSHPSQGAFVVLDKADFDPAKHEPLDDQDLGDSAGITGDGVPTLKELLAGREQLLARKDQLDDQELQLIQRSDALGVREQELLNRESELVSREQALMEREQANKLEAERLAALAAANTGSAIDPATMTKAQLQAALTAKGTSYPAAADKADLIALLTAAH